MLGPSEKEGKENTFKERKDVAGILDSVDVLDPDAQVPRVLLVLLILLKLPRAALEQRHHLREGTHTHKTKLRRNSNFSRMLTVTFSLV